jgi:CDP-paratose 2-epimerase
MKVLITGGCGFIGSSLSLFLKENSFRVSSLDNLSRSGSILNLKRLKKKKIKNYKINQEESKKIIKLPKFDVIIDCCAEASVEASKKSPQDAKRVFNTNLVGTFNILQKCIKDKSKIIFLSTSRVYAIQNLRNLINSDINISKPIKKNKVIKKNFSTEGPKSLYGFTKLASEYLIEEISYSNDIKYLINRLGVISGPWQFGKVDQGFVSLWIWRHINKLKLSYIGFGGNGHQLRDILHIDDLCALILKQIKKINTINNKIFTAGGGKNNAVSLKDLTLKVQRFSNNKISFTKIKKTSIFDVPYFISCNEEVKNIYNWKPKKNITQIVQDIYKWQMSNLKNLKKYF